MNFIQHDFLEGSLVTGNCRKRSCTLCNMNAQLMILSCTICFKVFLSDRSIHHGAYVILYSVPIYRFHGRFVAVVWAESYFSLRMSQNNMPTSLLSLSLSLSLSLFWKPFSSSCSIVRPVWNRSTSTGRKASSGQNYSSRNNTALWSR